MCLHIFSMEISSIFDKYNFSFHCFSFFLVGLTFDIMKQDYVNIMIFIHCTVDNVPLA